MLEGRIGWVCENWGGEMRSTMLYSCGWESGMMVGPE